MSESDPKPTTPADDWMTSRRTFLRAAGFTFASAMITGCQSSPIHHAIPYLVQPEDVVPGRPVYYAGTCSGCSSGCGVLVKNRDGRPIKIEGYTDHALSQGGVCAVGQAHLLGLYDNLRFSGPRRDGQPVEWTDVDAEIAAQIAKVKAEGGAVRYLSGTVSGPASRTVVEKFLGGFADARWVMYDPISSSAILDSHERTHGARVLPRYRFEKADVVVSFGADFLGTWTSPVEHTAGYRARRTPDDPAVPMSYHVQFESRLSTTGGKADRRFRVAPSEMGALVSGLAALVARKAGTELAGAAAPAAHAEALAEVAERLWAAKGKCLVVSGSQDVQVQALCNFINHLLGNYDQTLDVTAPSNQRLGSDSALAALLDELRGGRVKALFIDGVDPVYDLGLATELADAIRRVPLVVNFASRNDETAVASKFVCPDHHALESWTDSEPVRGIVNLSQPATRPLLATRSVLESLSAWMGEPRSILDIVRSTWETKVFPRQTAQPVFLTFWERSVQDGFCTVTPEPVAASAFNLAAVKPAGEAHAAAAGQLEVVVYPTVGMLDGRHAYNAWLHEMPDPMTRVTWDSYACLAPATAKRLGLSEGDVVRVATAEPGASVECSVVIQPGQHESVVSLPMGYGSRLSERFANVGPQWLESRTAVGDDGRVGRHAGPFVTMREGARLFDGHPVQVSPTGRSRPLAAVQLHHALTAPEELDGLGFERRDIVRQTTFAELHDEKSHGGHGEHHGGPSELWPQDHPVTGPKWGMSIDLSACTGCSACVVACQVENNVPVVGRDEVMRHREMHWIRIDRYYEGDGDDVSFQPMMCQQCGVAGCETVCPALATLHSEDGLNQQVYNRCVGTRYCANNCAYKVRRFNWFDYPHADRFENLVLNPDVVVRSRGVMEKCSFCVQRIQEARIAAKARGEAIADGAIQPACQQTCPARAITFGDLNDPNSALSKANHGRRSYRVLEEVGTEPSVTYRAVVRNREGGEGHHG